MGSRGAKKRRESDRDRRTTYYWSFGPKWRNGRRGGLKHRWAKTRVGSTPTFGTTAERRLTPGECARAIRQEAATAEWCNGSTRVFGAFGRGSNPCSATTNLNIP